MVKAKWLHSFEKKLSHFEVVPDWHCYVIDLFKSWHCTFFMFNYLFHSLVVKLLIMCHSPHITWEIFSLCKPYLYIFHAQHHYLIHCIPSYYSPNVKQDIVIKNLKSKNKQYGRKLFNVVSMYVFGIIHVVDFRHRYRE